MKDYMDYVKDFYTDYFKHCSAAELVKREDEFSKLIDDDFSADSLLLDETLLLYELVRNECVHRVSLMAHSQE